MKKVYSLGSLLPYLILSLFFGRFTYAQSFNASGLEGENLVSPTSLDFGPNGKLYVSQQDGTLFEYTVFRDGADAGKGTYAITDSKPIDIVKTGIPNHNDDGTINTGNKRQVTGLLATGTAEVPVLYVSSSDSRIGGYLKGDSNLDTNSGVLSRLTWTGSSWDKVDLVRGLPRCEENHSTNGMDIFERNGITYLLLQQGGDANKGAPSNNFAGTSETSLSASLLIVNLTQLEQMETANGGPYLDTRQGTTKYIYDLPTLNDPSRPDITNTNPDFPYQSGHPLYNATIDRGDPFGGNNSLNQAFAEPGGPVQIFSPGYRNAYDVLVTTDGRIFAGDNGPNSNWGGTPVIYDSNGNKKSNQDNGSYHADEGDYITNDFNESNSGEHGDILHYVGTINDANGTYYGGHPVPIRAFPSRAGVKVYTINDNDVWVETSDNNFGDLLVGVSGYFKSRFTISDFPDDPRQGEYLANAVNDSRVNILDVIGFSTNGICEYTASNFDGAMQGDILTASYANNGFINRYHLDASGTEWESKNNNFLSGFGVQPLDVIAQGDTDPFPGTIWAATYGEKDKPAITVFEPADFTGCLAPDDPGYVGTEDYDSDGFTNDDEVANGTDICSGGSKPSDNDGDFISDLIDPDDDNDGIDDVADAFAMDADNGTQTHLPITYPFWNNDPGTGLYGLGFTGLMLDPSENTDYLDQFDPGNLTFGGAGGKATIDVVGTGDARGAANTQYNGFQVGVNVDSNSAPFTAQTKIENLTPVRGLSVGMYIGTGDQDHYLSVAVTEGTNNTDDIYGFEVLTEDGPQDVLSQKYDVPGVLGNSGVDIYINVNPAANTAQPYYSIDGGATVVSLGSPITLPTSFLNPDDNQGLAVGLISTSAGSSSEFSAQWDFLNVIEDGDTNLVLSDDPVDFGILNSGSGQVKLVPSLTNQGGAAAGAIEVTAVTITGADAALFESVTELPLLIGPGTGKNFPLNFNPNTIDGAKTANLEIVHTGVNSPYVVPLNAILGDTGQIAVQAIADQLNEVGDKSELAVRAGGGDPQENFTYAISGQPDGIGIEPTNGQIFGTLTEAALQGGPNNDGVHIVTIEVSKPGSETATMEFIWTVAILEWSDMDEAENYTARHECSFVQAGDKFYLMGGRENAKTIDVYDYATDTWIQIPDSPPVEFNHFQATQYKGLIWVIGAFMTNNYPNEQPADYVWAFDPAKQEWIQGPEIPEDRRRGSAGLVVHNDKFYISGGNTMGHDGGYVSYFDEYDPATGVWNPLADAPRARDHFHAAVMGDKMYLAGGRLSGGEQGVFKPTIAEVDIYDFATGTWSTLPADQNLPTLRAGATVANFKGQLVVIGGEVENEQVYGETVSGALKITERYDPGTRQWTRLPDMNHARHATQAIVSGNGIFVTAGSDRKGGANQKNMEYLGLDAPMGSPSMSSTLTGPEVVAVAVGSSQNFELNVSGGNVGIIIRSLELSGVDAAHFSITGGTLESALLGSQDSHTVTLSLDDAGEDAEAVLTINYGADASLDIPLRSRVPPPILTQPDTQYNAEGDDVSLQIEASGAGDSLTYAATGLPPTLAIDATTGLIIGTIGEGAEADSPYQVTITATDAAVPENPGTVEFSWIIDNDGNPSPGDILLVLYPNPASSQMTLGFANNVRLKAVRIFDRGGRLMTDLDPNTALSNGNYVIDVSTLSEGLYFVNTVDDKGNKGTQQMVIKH